MDLVQFDCFACERNDFNLYVFEHTISDKFLKLSVKLIKLSPSQLCSQIKSDFSHEGKSRRN